MSAATLAVDEYGTDVGVCVEATLRAELAIAERRYADLLATPASSTDPIYAIRLTHWAWKVSETERRITAWTLDNEQGRLW